MPWLTDKYKPHKCNRPHDRKLKGRVVGDMWQCRKCGQQWKITQRGTFFLVFDIQWATWERI